MEKFKITLTEKQQNNLKKAGFVGLANDPDGLDILCYIKPLIDYLATHNKNYTKTQCENIDILNDIITALYDGI